ncbi:hypothetical protein BW723_06550 [Polaribacter reichenbachii]|uniref:Secretion system C-terminal sorting domain-containing protein n=1 Tax=Polaribacter reichenbachii TaxID=996801 RepID=A0A1B8U624_9FLAO|nr:hypothetical protein [Polaribacter reichenbachii]APZ45973.1 hypothetical protein BW723_06550 [Polaribacter reichenbachii]AUC19835.1 hypothetical protein BTO17_14570 [Polaribacter reichenbachii]OBY67310.1 hypothetical protein LPB301_02940 [Polaribacter reichenbachii]
MNTLKKTILVASLMLGAFTNFANNTKSDNTLNASKVKVVFNEVKKGQQLTILDMNGVVLYTENVAETGKLIKTFDFSQLNDGDYFLELEKDFQIVVKSLKIENNKVVFYEDTKKVILKPVIRTENNLLMITSFAFDEKPLEVVLYYNNEIIYSETIEGDSVLNRVYKLDKKVKGNYKAVVKNNGRNYSNDFKI